MDTIKKIIFASKVENFYNTIGQDSVLANKIRQGVSNLIDTKIDHVGKSGNQVKYYLKDLAVVKTDFLENNHYNQFEYYNGFQFDTVHEIYSAILLLYYNN